MGVSPRAGSEVGLAQLQEDQHVPRQVSFSIVWATCKRRSACLRRVRAIRRTPPKRESGLL